jgi:hypothetical protein
MARIARVNDFENPRVPHLVLNELVDIAHTEGPVRHAHGQTVDCNLGHEARRYDLELDGIEVESEAVGKLLDLESVETTVAGHGLSPPGSPVG